MKTVLVTGLNGFVGTHLSRFLVANSSWQLLSVGPCDLTIPDEISQQLKRVVPDAVIHLAGQTHVPTSFKQPHYTFNVNLLGTLNLLEALRRINFKGRLLYVSSGDVYGQIAESSLPFIESLPVSPRNPYAVSKVSAELLCQQYGLSNSLDVVIARPFNHIGPGQRDDFVVASVAKQIVQIRKGYQAPKIEVGDIDVSRDFLDVRDVISAYFALLEGGHSGDIYNVCSGIERTVRSLIHELEQLANVHFELVHSSNNFRVSDQRRVVGCSDKIQCHTGWKPSITIKESLQSVLSDWDKRVV